MPDEKWGDKTLVCGFAVMRGGIGLTDRAKDINEIGAHCRKLLASYKCPRYVVFADIPRTSTGKVQKFALREQLANNKLTAQKIPAAKK